jgi:hypothetical protein
MFFLLCVTRLDDIGVPNAIWTSAIKLQFAKKNKPAEDCSTAGRFG